MTTSGSASRSSARRSSAPARQIAENAGVDGAVVVGKLLESTDSNWGFDAQANEYGDLIAKGIIDPTKVVRTALQDAASVAGLLITTEAMVAEKPKKESPDAGRRPRWRHGRHGRHGLLIPTGIVVAGKGRGQPRPFSFGLAADVARLWPAAFDRRVLPRMAEACTEAPA